MSIEPILEMMEQFIELHTALLDFSNRKTPVIVANKIDELSALVSKENKLIRQITELDQTRILLIGNYLISRGYKPDPRVTINELIKIIFKAEEKTQLANKQTKLLLLLDELKNVNNLNQQLIQQSLSFIDFSLDLLCGPSGDEAVYSNPLSQNKSMNRLGVFDSRA